jgi:signal peptidase I
MNALYFYLFLLVHPYLAMWWKSFEQADRKQWEALIPVYNYFVVFKIGANKPWWSFLMLFPGVHLVMWSVANVSYIRRFGYFSLVDTLQGVFFPYIIMYKIATNGDKILPETNWANSKEVGEREWGDHLALFLSLPVLGHVIALGFAAVSRPKPGKKTKVKEWGDSIIFALVAASIIRTYVFEPFKIPTGSMEKTLLVGDFLFVNKLAYGPKVPVTPLSYPLVHNTVPWVNMKSYTSLETSNYTRLPGFKDVDRYDVVVFNYPAGDTSVYDPRVPYGLMGHNYYGVVLSEAKRMWEDQHRDKISRTAQEIQVEFMENNRNIALTEGLRYKFNAEATEKIWDVYGQSFIDEFHIWKAKARNLLVNDRVAYDPSLGEMINHYGLIHRPVDKRENYIKRCVGLPGDKIKIVNSVLYVNGKKARIAENQNLMYSVQGVSILSPGKMDEKYGLEAYPGYNRRDYVPDIMSDNIPTPVLMHLTPGQLKKLKREFPQATFDLVLEERYAENDSIKPSVTQQMDNLEIFPNDLKINNTRTNFAEFTIPKKGATVEINTENIAWYRRIIDVFEGHDLVEKKDGTILIDGKKATKYTFEMNYYWMMGDNRYNSIDSRMWGFVPEDHIVGKASMVWFSRSPYKGIRTERLFTIIK